MQANKKKEITKEHDIVINAIQKALKNVPKDIELQKEIFYKDPEYKKYKGVRYDKRYTKCKNHVLKRFNNACCVCLSTEKVVWHHLYSYKYYPDLRTDLNNGVCVCEICHSNFNALYGNVNTLEQFIEFRNTDKNKDGKKLTFAEEIEFRKDSYFGIKEQNTPKQIIKANDGGNTLVKRKETPKEKQNQKKIIDSFESLKSKLASERVLLQEKYGHEKGIKIDFRGKKTTYLSAITNLLKEIMRISTLISCNKIRDKKLMASKFHMTEEYFCKKLQDPTQYLDFTDSEITHLNNIFRNDYPTEYQARNEEINKRLHKK
jgi:hypothetical protein